MGPSTAQWRVERAPLGIGDLDVEQRQERRQDRLKPPIQVQDLTADLLPDRMLVVTGLDLEIDLEQLDDRQIERSFSVGDGGALEDEPVLGKLRVGRLPDQAGLPHARIADQRDDLPMPRCGLLERFEERSELMFAPDEVGQAPRGRRLKARPDRPGPDELERFDRLGHTFDGDLPDRPNVDIPLRQPEHGRGEQDTTLRGVLLHAGGQMDRLPHGRVVHPQVVRDRANDDLT
jgi:hypothetical protein